MLWLLFAACRTGAECGLADIDLTEALDAAQVGRATRCQQAGLGEWLTRRRATHGPWKQDISVARSEDGLRWEVVRNPDGWPLVVVPTAAVPEAVQGADGRIWLFFVDGDLDALARGAGRPEAGFATMGLPGVGALGAAVSSDGIRFQRVPDAQIQGLGVGLFADPEVVPTGDGGWRMYYLAMSTLEYTQHATWKEGERHEIHSAVSRDLVRWTSEGAVVRGPFADPALACFQGGSCTLFSYGLQASYSRDGRHFDHAGSWEGVRGFAPEVFAFSPTEARLYYNDAESGAPLRARITRDAGMTWTAEAEAALDVYGEAPSVLRRADGSWLMYFHTFKPGMRLAEVPDPASAIESPAGDAPTAAAPPAPPGR